MERLAEILEETGTACYAWALLPNHLHLLLRTGTTPLSQVMRRLLTGYAVVFNLKHKRQGHLFQNRYKSILCQEEPYFLELVRYIHLNPLRAGEVPNFDALSKASYSGHSAVLGHTKREWQDVDFVLRFFGEGVGAARQGYREYVKAGIEQGRRPDLIGGGLLRSHGGWTGVKALRESGTYQKGDERILGEGAFVERVLAEVEENFERRYRLVSKGFNLERIAQRVSELLGVSPEEVLEPGQRGKARVKARSLVCYWAAMELGMKQGELAKMLRLTQPAISMAIRRGAQLAGNQKFTLEG